MQYCSFLKSGVYRVRHHKVLQGENQSPFEHRDPKSLALAEDLALGLCAVQRYTTTGRSAGVVH